MNDDTELLRRYVLDRSEEAFSEIVARHVNLVYSAALRQLNGDAHLAADATQLVFADLARKAETLLGHRVLAGWLFTSTRFVTAKLVRAERRRQAREQEAHLMQEVNRTEAAQPDWQRIRPVLDEAMSELSDSDREAILLRFFEGRDYAGVGVRLNIAANAARMRVERALEKLRGLLERRGMTSTGAALGAMLAEQAVMAAPAGLAATVAGAALSSGAVVTVAAGGTAAGGSGLTALANFMSMTKLQLGVSSALAVAGASGYVIQAGTVDALRDEIAHLRRDGEAVAELRVENERLAKAAAQAESLRIAERGRVQLEEEASLLKRQVQARATPPVKAAAAPAVAPAVLSGPVYDISKLTQTPKAKFQARPNYPAELRTSGVGGEVVVDFVVDVQGNVQNAFALRSSRYEFESAAVDAVSKWKFAPGEISGAAVNTHMQIPIVFRMAKPSEEATAPTFWF